MTAVFEIELNPTNKNSTELFWKRFWEHTHGDEVIVTGVRGGDISKVLEDNRTSTFGVEPASIRTTHSLNVYNPLFYALLGHTFTESDFGFRGFLMYNTKFMLPVGSTSVLWRHAENEPVNTAVEGLIEIKLEN